MPFTPSGRALGAAAFLALAAAPALAQDLHGDDTRFNLFNDTSRGVEAFSVMMPWGQFSGTWLESRLAPGTGLTLQFPFDPEGQCDLKTRVSYQDGSVLDLLVTYCGLAAIFLEDTGVRFD